MQYLQGVLQVGRRNWLVLSTITVWQAAQITATTVWHAAQIVSLPCSVQHTEVMLVA